MMNTSEARRPVVDGWFTTDGSSAASLIGSRCRTCTSTFFPPVPASSFCRNPRCDGEAFEATALSRTGRVWSYTDAQYQPPAPYIAPDPYVPFALAAVELPEGLVVLGQLAQGHGVDSVKVGTEVELVIETLYVDDSGERTVWRWRPTTGASDDTAAHGESA